MDGSNQFQLLFGHPSGAHRHCFSQFTFKEVKPFLDEFWALSKSDQDTLASSRLAIKCLLFVFSRPQQEVKRNQSGIDEDQVGFTSQYSQHLGVPKQ